jgi:RHS repeat-associated protein
MAEQHSQTADYENRFKFTGHELGKETGLYYAGARYYDPKISIWLSVDPLLEKHRVGHRIVMASTTQFDIATQRECLRAIVLRLQIMVMVLIRLSEEK